MVPARQRAVLNEIFRKRMAVFYCSSPDSAVYYYLRNMIVFVDQCLSDGKESHDETQF